MPGIQPTVEIGRAAVRDAEVGQAPARAEDGVEVHHRLAHAHEDRVVDSSSMRRKCSAWSRISEAVRLRPNFIEPGRAERAGQRAARLRRQAQRAPAVAVAHEHGLDGPPVGGVKERLVRPVAGDRLVGERQRRERHLVVQARAQRGRHVGHRLVAARAARGPRPRLAGAEGRLAGVGQRALQQLEIHPLIVGGRSADVVELEDRAAAGGEHRHAGRREVVRALRVEVIGHEVPARRPRGRSRSRPGASTCLPRARDRSTSAGSPARPSATGSAVARRPSSVTGSSTMTNVSGLRMRCCEALIESMSNTSRRRPSRRTGSNPAIAVARSPASGTAAAA